MSHQAECSKCGQKIEQGNVCCDCVAAILRGAAASHTALALRIGAVRKSLKETFISFPHTSAVAQNESGA